MPEGSFWTRALRLLKSWKRDWTAGRAARGLVTRGQVRGLRHPLRMPEMQRTPERASAQEKPGPTRTAQRCGDGPAGVPQDVSPKQYGPGGWPGPYLFLTAFFTTEAQRHREIHLRGSTRLAGWWPTRAFCWLEWDKVDSAARTRAQLTPNCPTQANAA